MTPQANDVGKLPEISQSAHFSSAQKIQTITKKLEFFKKKDPLRGFPVYKRPPVEVLGEKKKP